MPTAIATRCCSPPDISAGRRSAQCETSSRSSSSATRARRAAPPFGSPVIASAAATFSLAVRYGRRLREVCCHTNPTLRRRNATRSFSFIVSRSCPATHATPAVGWSRLERIDRSVDLPEPEAPTPRRARRGRRAG